ncbi:competence protein ComK [Bacillus piscicola]|uniref:competence protein ComK n=1 Tax=Bacillus piscicola TaxID=1632684 RepID=UPI001F08D515|nr:competence protein ComK [Bacillus piscicola]
MEKEIIEDYIIHYRTMALVPEFVGQAGTRVLETGGVEILALHSPLRLIKQACLHHGASLEGRYEAVKHRLDMKQKLPVPISRQEGIYAFPLLSTKRPDNIWLFYDHVDRAVANQPNASSTVYFYNGQWLPTDVSAGIINQQILKARRCKSAFQEVHQPDISLQNIFPNAFAETAD